MKIYLKYNCNSLTYTNKHSTLSIGQKQHTMPVT